VSLRDELEAMLQKARRYIDSAEVLRQRGDFDSAISRLYYAMFYCAEALLRARGHSFSSHRAVISAFAQQFVKPGLLSKDLHKWLQTAFEKRQVGDYEFISTAEDPEVLEMASQARAFLSMIEELLKKEGHL
jgi:uncharacterized protein (UPF0332 family)